MAGKGITDPKERMEAAQGVLALAGHFVEDGQVLAVAEAYARGELSLKETQQQILALTNELASPSAI